MKELEKVVYFETEVESPQGPELEKTYEVKGHPTFILMSAKGEQMDRWAGFNTVADWIPIYEDALSDPTLADDKLARIKTQPDAKLAARLGRIHSTRGQFADAAGFYRQAQELNKDAEKDYAYDLFEAQAIGFYRAKAFTADEVAKSADAVMASKKATPPQIMRTGSIMTAIATKSENKALAKPYLETAVKRTEGVTDPEQQKQRARLLVDHALYVKEDKTLALDLERKTLPENWMQDTMQMNRFAWWCFENKINLEEAEQVARKGIEVAKSGSDKAELYDTAAEICNARGNCKDSVELIEMAMKEDPNNKDLQKQLEKFQKLLAERK
jgi:tetratricopeptide (TPR) repeat protein